MKFKRKNDKVRIDLQGSEGALLGTLLDDLALLLDADDTSDPAIRRLYPDGYSEDPDGSREFRELVAEDLRSERTGRLQALRAEIASAGGRIELDDEGVDRWIRVINDVRLALGTRLGVTEDDDGGSSDDEAMDLYHWLSAVQENLVMQVMG